VDAADRACRGLRVQPVLATRKAAAGKWLSSDCGKIKPASMDG
jgi:hypothetical protein